MTTTPASDLQVAEIARAISIRADRIRIMVSDMAGALGRTRPSLRHGLEVLRDYPDSLIAAANNELGRSVDAVAAVGVLEPLLRHAMQVLDLIERHFSHGPRLELSEAVADEIRNELGVLQLDKYHVVLSHGEANNFGTTFGDLVGNVYGIFAATGHAVPPPDLFAMFIVPRLEGSGAQWRPVILGHEVGHIAVREFDAVTAFGLAALFDVGRAAATPVPRAEPSQYARTLFNIAQSWLVELLCDVHAIRRFGPGAVASLWEYLRYVGATVPSATHPPLRLRAALALKHAGTLADLRLAELLKPCAQYLAGIASPQEPWVEFLSEMFLVNADKLKAIVDAWPAPAYDADARSSQILEMADRLKAGIPGEAVRFEFGKPRINEPADAVNAAWVARVENAHTPFDRLAIKTVESIDFVTRWQSSGGTIPESVYVRDASVETVDAAEAGSAILNASQIRQRLQLIHDTKALAISPLLHEPSGTGIDVRLGSRFIVFGRTSVASFDPLGSDDSADGDPRALQMYTQVSQSEQFVLHPQEIVLGATMEYLVMPDDLSAQVITRSSYGRLGLLTATAVQVHPGFRGCLTLELANLSTIPIALTPGERIAQLVFWRTGSEPVHAPKYDCPIGPEFSRVRSDTEKAVLRQVGGKKP